MSKRGRDNVVCSSGRPREAPPTRPADPRVCLRTLGVRHGIREQALEEARNGGSPGARWAANAARKVEEELKTLSRDQQDAIRAILPDHLPRAIRRWVLNFEQRGSVDDAPRSGRPRIVSQEVAKEAADAVLAQHPVTQREAKRCTAVRMALRKTGATLRTLYRAMRRVYPKLSKTKLFEYKLPLTEANKKARVACAKRLLRLGTYMGVLRQGTRRTVAGGTTPIPGPRSPKTRLRLKWVNRIIWIDAKKFYIKPTDFEAWGLRGSPSTVIGDKRVRGKMVIHYYAAVNLKHGGIMIKFVTGTKGPGYQHRVYKVSVQRTPQVRPDTRESGARRAQPPALRSAAPA